MPREDASGPRSCGPLPVHAPARGSTRTRRADGSFRC